MDRHWVWFEGGRLLGSASLRWGQEPGQLRMILLVEPEYRDQIEQGLITTSMRRLRPYGEAVIVDYPTGAAEQVFRNNGFKDRRRLVWMSLRV
jgi:hypothetical protein